MTYQEELTNRIYEKAMFDFSLYGYWNPCDEAKEWVEDNITIYDNEDVLFAGYINNDDDDKPYIWFIQMPTDDSLIWYCTVDAGDIYHDEDEEKFDDVVERLGLDDLDRLDYMFLKI